MKKIVKIAILTLVVAACAAMATACNKVESINIKNANMPNQLVYVVGSELDLSGGSLSVVGKKETTLIELDSPGVTISGYDKNKIGQQELTVSYEGQTTTFSVTVVPRMVAENIVLDYFTGDDFNDKGRVKITRDDGTSFTVSLSEESISISGFDSSVAKSPVEVTATYAANGETYVGSFNVNVYDVSETDFKEPTYKSYLSHDEEINLDGSYFTIKGGPDGELTRYIEVTEDMISGFNPGAATAANVENPLTQKVTVTYSGKEYFFDVSITYTNVSLIKDTLSTFEGLDWMGEAIPEVSTDEGEQAIVCWNAYKTLSDSEKELFTMDELLSFVRPATVYAYNLWVEEIIAYPDAFNALVSGPQLVCKTQEATAAAYAALTDEDNIINVAGKILSDINTEFGSQPILGENLISTFTSIVYTSETIAKFSGYMSYLLNLYDLVEEIPEEWTVASLSGYSQQIVAIMDFISQSELATKDYATFYDCVSSWRKNHDFAEILFNYYYYVETDEAAKEAAIALLKNLRLPGELEELYTAIVGAMNEISSMQSGKQPSTTVFMLYYDMALNSIDKITNGSDELCKELYKTLEFDGMLTIGGEPTPVPFSTLMLYIETATGGYYYHTNALYGDEVFEDLWDKYFTVLYGVMENSEEYPKSEQFKKDIDSAFRSFVEASPSWQYGYIVSLHTYYRGSSSLAFDVMNTGMFSLFVEYSAEYYYFALPEGATREIFTDLLLALEYYAKRSVDSGALTEFLTKMYTVTTKYSQLSDDDRAAFNSLLGFFYEKYADIYARYADVNNPTVTDLGEWKDEFDAIKLAIEDVDVAYTYMTKETDSIPLNIGLLSACEQVFKLTDYVKQNAPVEIVDAFNYENYVTLSDGRTVTLEFGLFFVKSVYSSFLRNSNIYNTYTGYTALREFLVYGYDFFWTVIYLDEEAELKFTDAEYVYNVMAKFRALSKEEQSLFYAIDSPLNSYQVGLIEFFAERLSDASAAVAEYLVELEVYYVFYANKPDGTITGDDGSTITYKQMLDDAMNTLKTAFKALTDEQQTEFLSVADEMYDYYCNLYNTLFPAQPNA